MPEPGSDDPGENSGGIFSCYVDADDLRTAEFRAIALVQEQGLLPKRIEAWDLISAESAESKAPAEGVPTERELVEQALVDGACGVVHTWPTDE